MNAIWQDVRFALRGLRQLLVECLTISFPGAAIGVGLSFILAELPLKLLPVVFPSEALVRINLPVMGLSAGVALLAGLLFGLLPAVRFSRPQISQAMQAGTRTSSGSKTARGTLQVLIGGQVALTLVLLAAAAAAAIGGFYKILHTPLGYEPVNTVQIGEPFCCRRNVPRP